MVELVCTPMFGACVAAEAIAGLAMTAPAAPSARISEKKMGRPVRMMIPPLVFPEASNHTRGDSESPYGGSTS